jgi:hypothetical protein
LFTMGTESLYRPGLHRDKNPLIVFRPTLARRHRFGDPQVNGRSGHAAIGSRDRQVLTSFGSTRQDIREVMTI